jgi:DNA polymerase-3 subunit epsilon
MGADMGNWVTGPLVGFDLETTGTDPFFARPVSYSLVWSENGDTTRELSGLVDPGVPIPEGASAVHGITAKTLATRPHITLDAAINAIRSEIVGASAAGIPLVGMNLKYDLTIIDCLGRALDGCGLMDLGWNGPVIDILVIDRAIDRYRRGARTLSALAVTYGVPLADAHEAGADVIASLAVLAALAGQYPDQVQSISPDALHTQQVIWHRDWADNYSSWRESKGQPPLGAHEFVWPLPSGVSAP